MKTTPVIGRFCLVRDLTTDHQNWFYGATVIDKVAKTNQAKRVRLQTGEHAGEVRMRGQYEIFEYL